MLAFGWTIERTKDGDSSGMHACTRSLSQSGQVCALIRLVTINLLLTKGNHVYVVCLSCLLKEHQPLALNLWT